MSNRKSVTLRTFVENAVKSTPRKGSATERRRSVVTRAIEAATKGTVRRKDGARYANTESVRVYATQLFNEIAG